MNILEGLKRIYVVLAVLPVLICIMGGWETWGRRPYPFTYGEAMAEGYSSAQVADHLASLYGQNMSNLRENGVSDDQLIGSLLSVSFTPDGRIHPRTGEDWLRELPETWIRKSKRAAYSALGAIVSVASMTLIWFVIRWVIVGFFPSLAKKRAAPN